MEEWGTPYMAQPHTMKEWGTPYIYGPAVHHGGVGYTLYGPAVVKLKYAANAVEELELSVGPRSVTLRAGPSGH